MLGVFSTKDPATENRIDVEGIIGKLYSCIIRDISIVIRVRLVFD